MAVLASCDGTTPSAPDDLVRRPMIAGNYELIAAGETTSKAWETYAVRIEATLRIEQDSLMPSKVSGSFTNLRFMEAGLDGYWALDGVIVGSIDASGWLTIQLKSQRGDFTWTGRGLVVGTQISGQWESSNPAAGGFSAQLKPAAVEAAYPDINGVYAVDAPFTGFDPAWGDFTGYRYTAVLTLKRDAQGPGLGGTFTDFQITDGSGQIEDWRASGTLRGDIAPDGKLTLELSAVTQSFTWSARGTFKGDAIEGTWGRAGHISGSFTAVRR